MKGRKALTAIEYTNTLNSFVGTYASRDRTLFLLMAKTGFRVSEALTVQVKDIYQLGKIVDSLYVAKRNMKGKAEGRSVVLAQSVKEALLALIVEAEVLGKPEAYVFASRKGFNKPLGAIQAWRAMKLAFNKAGVTGPTGTHSCRKTFAEKVHNRLGRDIFKTAKALGHKNIDNTANYLSFADSEINKAITEE